MKTVALGRVKFEAHAGGGGLLTVILHSAKGQQQVEMTPGEFRALEMIADALDAANRALDASSAEIRRLDLELAKARAELAELRAKQAAFVEASHG